MYHWCSNKYSAWHFLLDIYWPLPTAKKPHCRVDTKIDVRKRRNCWHSLGKHPEYELFLYDGMSDETIDLGAWARFAGYSFNNRSHLWVKREAEWLSEFECLKNELVRSGMGLLLNDVMGINRSKKFIRGVLVIHCLMDIYTKKFPGIEIFSNFW